MSVDKDTLKTYQLLYFQNELPVPLQLKNGKIDVYPRKREAITITYDVEWINQFLGTAISEEDMIKIFESIEFKVNQADKTVTIPTFRSDVTMMADLAEEVARLYGYDKIV